MLIVADLKYEHILSTLHQQFEHLEKKIIMVKATFDQ